MSKVCHRKRAVFSLVGVGWYRWYFGEFYVGTRERFCRRYEGEILVSVRVVDFLASDTRAVLPSVFCRFLCRYSISGMRFSRRYDVSLVIEYVPSLLVGRGGGLSLSTRVVVLSLRGRVFPSVRGRCVVEFHVVVGYMGAVLSLIRDLLPSGLDRFAGGCTSGFIAAFADGFVVGTCGKTCRRYVSYLCGRFFRRSPRVRLSLERGGTCCRWRVYDFYVGDEFVVYASEWLCRRVLRADYL